MSFEGPPTKVDLHVCEITGSQQKSPRLPDLKAESSRGLLSTYDGFNVYRCGGSLLSRGRSRRNQKRNELHNSREDFVSISGYKLEFPF